MTVTIKDIARYTGVSLSTVSRALAGDKRIPSATRDRIVRASKLLNYRPNRLARGLVQNRSTIWGLIIPDLSNPFFGPVIDGVEEVAMASGYIIVIGQSKRKLAVEKEWLNQLEELRIEGLIITPTMASLTHLTEMQGRGRNVVVLGRQCPGFDFVTVDDVEGGYAVGQYLLQLGHQRIGCVISGEEHHYPEKWRLRGLERSLRESPNEIHLEIIKAGYNTIDGGLGAAEAITKMPVRPSAVFAAMDLLALGLMQGFRKNGIRVPDDISIIGYDDIPFSQMAETPLTTVSPPKETMGRIAAQLLLKKIDRKEVTGTDGIFLPPTMKIRNSWLPYQER